MQHSRTSNPPTVEQLGRFHTFGPFGPAYEVKGHDRPTEAGDWYMRVLVIESGEEVGYLASNIKADPMVEG